MSFFSQACFSAQEVVIYSLDAKLSRLNGIVVTHTSDPGTTENFIELVKDMECIKFLSALKIIKFLENNISSLYAVSVQSAKQKLAAGNAQFYKSFLGNFVACTTVNSQKRLLIYFQKCKRKVKEIKKLPSEILLVKELFRKDKGKLTQVT